MPDVTAIAQFERRLVELGCPVLSLSARVRELADHHEDLKQAALEEGLPETEAAARASDQLGDPILLAENAVRLLRQASWWGRHPILGFCVLPVLGFLPMSVGCWAFFAGLCWLLGRTFGPAYAMDDSVADALSEDLKLSNSIIGSLNTAIAMATLLLAMVVFCRLARRAALGLKWLLTVCVICSLCSFSASSTVSPHNFSLGIWWQSSHWFYAITPWLIALVLLARQRQQERRLNWVPMTRRTTGSRIFPARAGGWQIFWQTPTYWVITMLTLAIIALSFAGRAAYVASNTHRAELKSKIWPAERAATLAVLQARQAIPALAGENLVDLKPLLNMSLRDPMFGSNGIKDNNLAELPAGVHTFGGVAFDIAGRIQLADQPLVKSKQKYPVRVQLPVSGRCARIYLLHGAGNLRPPGVKIARLVWHYADGSKAESAIVGGEQVLDFWGPIYNTDSGDGRLTTSPDTELAWAGSNPGVRKRAPNYSLRLYKSAFANPHPELEITRIDYVSTLSGAAPFLVGLTTEPTPSPSNHP